MGVKEYARTQRIAQQLRREMGDILARQISDPRLERVTISAVQVSKDLAYAKVLFTLPKADDAPAVRAAFKGAAGFIRRQLAERLRMRSLPALRFIHDESLENALKLSELIDVAVAKDHEKGS